MLFLVNLLPLSILLVSCNLHCLVHPSDNTLIYLPLFNYRLSKTGMLMTDMFRIVFYFSHHISLIYQVFMIFPIALYSSRYEIWPKQSYM